MNVALNPELEKLVNEKVQSGQYRTPEAVVEEALQLLTERDRGEDRLEALLQEAENSGPAVEMTEQEWANIRRQVHERHAARR
jgi:putative addiction module CopG family antidote